jgi:nanoRNase/pAp phosphatase (c-di-AMP/oligoRNAs hydrolase)
MRYVLTTDSDLVPPLVAEAALPGETLTVLVADRNLARRLRRRGYTVLQGSPTRAATWRQAGLEAEGVIVVIALVRNADAADVVKRLQSIGPDLPVVLLDSADEVSESEAAVRKELDETENVNRVRLSDIVRAPFKEKFENAIIRKQVRAYREHFGPADRVLILMHDEPDPDAIASALALRALLKRRKQTATIGCFKAPTRPENVRMVDLLELDIAEITEEDLTGFDRIAVVDTQPHIFEGKVPYADLVIDQHPKREGYEAKFVDIRTSFGATTTMLLDYLVRADVPISERLATAAIYAIHTDTKRFEGPTNKRDVELFAHIFPKASQAALRRIRGEAFTLEHLRLLGEVAKNHLVVGHFLCTHLGEVPRDDYVPTIADLLIEPAEAHWCAVSGVLEDNLVISVRNLGIQKAAGDLTLQVYGEIGAAGGRRSAAKAIIPVEKVVETYGELDDPDFAKRLFKPLWEGAGFKAK